MMNVNGKNIATVCDTYFQKTCIRRVICVSLSIGCVLAGCIYEYKSLDRSFKVVFMDVGQGMVY